MRSVITGVFLIFVAVSPYSSVATPPCDCDGTENDTFRVCRNIRKNATDAETYCFERCTAHLASIKSVQEFQQLKDLIGEVENCSRKGGKSPEAFYIGAQDTVEGDWRWIDDGTFLNVTFSNWRTFPPDESTNGVRSKCNDQPDQQNICDEEHPVEQDYAVMQMCKGKTYGTWFDVVGNTTRPFICKTRKEYLKSGESTANHPNSEGVHPHITQKDAVTPTSTLRSNGDKSGEPTPPLLIGSSVSTTTTATTTTTDTDDVTTEDDFKRRLRCIVLSLQTPSVERNESLVQYDCETPELYLRNPILQLEEKGSRLAAEIAFNKALERPYIDNETVKGIQLRIVPIWSNVKGNASKLMVMTMHDNCDECDEIEVDHSSMTKVDKVAVVTKFERNVLDGSGVYNSSLEKSGDNDQSRNEKLAYVSEMTSVISVTLFKKTVQKGVHAVSVPTRIRFDIRKDDSLGRTKVKGKRSRISKMERKCVFMKGNGKWSTRGCAVPNRSVPSSVQCHCNHTTAFAVMVSLQAVEIPDWLETVLLCAEIIGVLFLGLTLAMLMLLKSTLKKGRIVTQLHLCLALFLMHIVIICASYATPIEGLCVALVALSHFLMISSAMWMLNEGIVLYKKTSSDALNFDIRKLLKWLILFGWVIPFLYAMLCLGIGMGLGVYIDTSVEYDDLESRDLLENGTDVNKYSMCWLSTKSYMVLAAIIPIAVILVAVICILIWVSRVIWTMNQHALDMMPSGVRNKHQSLKSTVRAVALLLPVLGVPWILAFMVNIDGAEVVFTAIHGITNGLQGVILFIIFIVVNRETRTSMKRRLSRSFSTGQTWSLSSTPTGVSRNRKKSRFESHEDEDVKSSTVARVCDSTIS